jgi:hypothetical protein
MRGKSLNRFGSDIRALNFIGTVAAGKIPTNRTAAVSK